MKRILLYGSTHCGDCGPVKDVFIEKNVKFAYVDITESMLHLKTFLKIRDHNDSHAEVRATGQVGIPTLFVDKETFTVSGPEHAAQLIAELGLLDE